MSSEHLSRLKAPRDHGQFVLLPPASEVGDALEAISAGWPAVCANLKSLLETGHVLPRAPWEMHAALRAAQLARNDPQPAGS